MRTSSWPFASRPSFHSPKCLTGSKSPAFSTKRPARSAMPQAKKLLRSPTVLYRFRKPPLHARTGFAEHPPRNPFFLFTFHVSHFTFHVSRFTFHAPTR